MTKSKSDNVSHLVEAAPGQDTALTTTPAADFAAQLSVDMAGTVADRADSAVLYMNRSHRNLLAAGLLLCTIKEETEHGAFSSLLAERGFEMRAAQRAMQYAKFMLDRQAEERAALMELPKTKVLLLANADPEVMDALLDDGADAVGEMTVRELRAKLRELQAQASNVENKKDWYEATIAGLEKKLAKTPVERQDAVPVAVADLRAEFVACVAKAEFALKSAEAIGPELAMMIGSPVHDWVDGTTRLAVSGLVALRLQIDGVLHKYTKLLPEGDRPEPVPSSYLSQDELAECAEAWKVLAQMHTYEQDLRTHQREEERRTGPGRRSNAPKPPKAGKAGKGSKA
jgi:hypothetical protein